ncbi:hypothetical protein AB4Y43_13715 [Paraburkholderia sp. BR10872]|uniref:hypothetical protein n=1 Tax=Paraburkholderia sp. BR10872 TaxID=3236989 RepID=UPI0034D1E78A
MSEAVAAAQANHSRISTAPQVTSASHHAARRELLVHEEPADQHGEARVVEAAIV